MKSELFQVKLLTIIRLNIFCNSAWVPSESTQPSKINDKTSIVPFLCLENRARKLLSCHKKLRFVDLVFWFLVKSKVLIF